jgi:Patched family
MEPLETYVSDCRANSPCSSCESGTVQFSGLAINPISYMCLVISIGLLVDFLMHVILRYYESAENTREAKVKDTLRTLGASILVGGISTCLGVLPLAFASSEILRTVFVCFIALVSLGVGHGLMLMPVLLSLWGPTVCVRMSHNKVAREPQIDEPLPIGRSRNQLRSAMSMTEELDVTEELDEEAKANVDCIPQGNPVRMVTIVGDDTSLSITCIYG